jgi:hypothetical protein
VHRVPILLERPVIQADAIVLLGAIVATAFLALVLYIGWRVEHGRR